MHYRNKLNFCFVYYIKFLLDLESKILLTKYCVLSDVIFGLFFVLIRGPPFLLTKKCWKEIKCTSNQKEENLRIIHIHY